MNIQLPNGSEEGIIVNSYVDTLISIRERLSEIAANSKLRRRSSLSAYLSTLIYAYDKYNSLSPIPIELESLTICDILRKL